MPHTPGPWKISKETTPGQFVTEVKIRSNDDSHVAVIGPCAVDANARLIAAAPDLLAALEECRDIIARLAQESPDGIPMWASAVHDQARTAIRKAEGV